MEKDFIEQRLDLANELIDRMVETDGLSYTINYLLDFGFTKDQLIDMYFDSIDIEKVEEERE